MMTPIIQDLSIDRLSTLHQRVVYLLLSLAAPLLFGCVTHSRLSYNDTVSSIRSMCQAHDVTTRAGETVDTPVFGITEEGGTDHDQWIVRFTEGHPELKSNVAFPKMTQITVVKQSSGNVEYRVQCLDAGMKIEAHNTDREKFWRARLASVLDEKQSNQ